MIRKIIIWLKIKFCNHMSIGFIPITGKEKWGYQCITECLICKKIKYPNSKKWVKNFNNQRKD